MDSITKINLFKTLFYVFLVSAIIFFILSIVLFFVFKIPQIYMMRTGRAQKKTVEEMKKINAETGRLEGVTPHGKKGMSQIFGSSDQLDAMSKTAVLMDYNVAGSAPQIASAPPVQTSAPPVQPPQEAAQTDVLSNNGTQEWSHRNEQTSSFGETTVLSNMDVTGSNNEQSAEETFQPNTSYGRFEITRQMIEIHSDEVIA